MNSFHQFAPALVIGALATFSAPALGQWSDNFDSYVSGSNIVGQGGWEEWAGGAGAWTANVSSTQARSGANSIDIAPATDVVHTYQGYTAGTWEYNAWQYIPSGTTGDTYFIMMQQYGATNKWGVQVKFNTSSGMVEADAGGGVANNSAIIYDKWVRIQVVIHLDDDWVQFYYNGVLFDVTSHPDHAVHGGGQVWTHGVFGNTTYGAPLEIGAVDLYGNLATSVYYDDITLTKMNKGVRGYGEPTPGSNGESRISAWGDCDNTNLLFGLTATNGPATMPGFLPLTFTNYPAGIPLIGITLYVDPALMILTPVTTDSAGGHAISIPMTAAYTGIRFFGQYIFAEAGGGISSSDAIALHVQ